MRNRSLLLIVPALAWAGTGLAEDAEGCKDHPLFTRLPGYSLASCDRADYEERRFNVGPVKQDPEKGAITATVPVQGALYTMEYSLDEGATRKSPLQIMRNFQNAAKAAGGSVEGEWQGWCVVEFGESFFQGGNSCANSSTTLKVVRSGREVWTLVHPGGEGDTFTLFIMEREAMKQDVSVNELLDKMTRDGFVTVAVQFDTAKATIQPASQALLDRVAEMMTAAPSLKIEVAGHTDDVGNPAANQALSEARAQSVVAALGQRGIAPLRMTAKGYGSSTPVADNRTEEGRARNRRVELVKR